MNCTAKEFLQLFFNELESQSIPYVILHSYQELPEKIDSDIDYAVADWALPRLPYIQRDVAHRCGWALAQTLQHGVFAFYAVLLNLQEPSETLKLDACSNYARARRFLISEKILLENRRPFRGFYIPSPASEFIYVLAKVFDAKRKSPDKYLSRLKELWEADPTRAEAHFIKVFGETGRTLRQWFDGPIDEWPQLGICMLARNRFGLALMCREAARIGRRILHPTGLYLAVLGSDGAGKSTLLSRLQNLLQPCFRSQKLLHFRPGILRKASKGTETNPHAKRPRSVLASWLKVFYYFADCWAGWLLLVLPGRLRSTLVIFDRSFDDLLVDPTRYRLRGVRSLVRILRCLLPMPDRTFVLSAPASLRHHRKPELPLEELERQQRLLQELASRPAYTLVSADVLPNELANTVARDVVGMLATREEQRVK